MSIVHAVKFVNLYAPSFTTYRDTGALYQKKNIICPTVLALFLKSQNAQKSKFSGTSPRTPLGVVYCESLHCYPRSLSWWQGTREPLRNNTIPVLGPSIRPRFYGSQGVTHYRVLSVVNHKYDYYTTNTQ